MRSITRTQCAQLTARHSLACCLIHSPEPPRRVDCRLIILHLTGLSRTAPSSRSSPETAMEPPPSPARGASSAPTSEQQASLSLNSTDEPRTIVWPPPTPAMLARSAALTGEVPPNLMPRDMNTYLKSMKKCEQCLRELHRDYPMSAENPGVCKDCPILMQRNREDPVQPESTEKCKGCDGPLDIGWIREDNDFYVSSPLSRRRHPPSTGHVQRELGADGQTCQRCWGVPCYCGVILDIHDVSSQPEGSRPACDDCDRLRTIWNVDRDAGLYDSDDSFSL